VRGADERRRREATGREKEEMLLAEMDLET
jgi:hypothetical protein